MPQPTGMRSHLPLGNRSRWTACHIPSIHFLWKWRRALYFSPWFPRRPNLQGHDESCKLSLAKRPYHGQPWAEHSETLISESKNLNRWNGGSRRRSPELSWMPQTAWSACDSKTWCCFTVFPAGRVYEKFVFHAILHAMVSSVYRCYHSKPARAEISEILPFSILIAVGDVMRAVQICQFLYVNHLLTPGESPEGTYKSVLLFCIVPSGNLT